MSLPIRPLPVAECWDCHSCAGCCRGHTVILDDEDRRRLEAQAWDRHPDFRGTPIVVRRGLLRPEYVLAQRADGSCVFLMENGYCRIHAEHGEPAKPWPCRMFPFQLIPVDKHIRLTMRRNCPSAAAGHGRPLSAHLDFVRSLAHHALPQDKPVPPPRIAGERQREWADVLSVHGVLERVMLDQRLPLVRRITMGLVFCDLLHQSWLHKLDRKQLGELARVLEQLASEKVGELFGERAAPSRNASLLFRQAAAEYARFHPNLGDRPSWPQRWRMLTAALRIARGKGQLPRIHDVFPQATFAELEQPLGSLPEPVMTPIRTYFEAMTASLQYCGSGRFGWSLVDGFRALGLAYPIAMWILRWLAAGAEPTAEQAIQTVCIVDRSHYYPLLAGYRHRKRLSTLARLGELERLVVWYAR